MPDAEASCSKTLVTKIIGDPNQKILNELQEIVDEVNDLELQIQKMSAEQLRDAPCTARNGSGRH